MDEDTLDLSAAFDLVNIDLLLTRLKILGVPNDIITLLEPNIENSMVWDVDIGTVQGSILGPVLYSLFIRPLYDIENLIKIADDNYIINLNKNKKTALKDLELKLERILKWLEESGLKVNKIKTELTGFHRIQETSCQLTLDSVLINSKNNINVLGMTFDSKLSWDQQVL